MNQADENWNRRASPASAPEGCSPTLTRAAAKIQLAKESGKVGREDLTKGRWYSGVRRLIGGIGLWNGHAFLGVTYKLGEYCEAAEWFLPENNYQLLELPE